MKAISYIEFILKEAEEWQFNNLSNVDRSIFASKAGGRKNAEIIEFSFLSIRTGNTPDS